MDQKKYNGWSNYATWRVKLEIFDSFGDGDETVYDSIQELETYLIDYANEYIDDQDNCPNIDVAGWAHAFLDDVDFREIAESIAAEYPDIISKK